MAALYSAMPCRPVSFQPILLKLEKEQQNFCFFIATVKTHLGRGIIY